MDKDEILGSRGTVWRQFGPPDLDYRPLHPSLAEKTKHGGAAKLNKLSRRISRYVSPGVYVGEYASRTTILFGGKTTDKTMESNRAYSPDATPPLQNSPILGGPPGRLLS
jgi:hypothetical protein